MYLEQSCAGRVLCIGGSGRACGSGSGRGSACGRRYTPNWSRRAGAPAAQGGPRRGRGRGSVCGRAGVTLAALSRASNVMTQAATTMKPDKSMILKFIINIII